MLTFFYELPPPLAPFCELLCIGLFNACPLVQTVHEIATEPMAIIYPFYCSLVVTNLRSSNKEKMIQN